MTRIYVLEVEAWTGAAVETLRYATHTLNTSATDTPANTTIRGLVMDPGSFKRSVSLMGQVSESRGGIVLNNADGRLDPLINYGWGRAFRLRELTDRSDPVGSAPIVASGIVLGIDSSSPFTELRLRLRDAMEAMKTPLLVERYAGTTTDGSMFTIEGDADLKGVLKPLCLSSRANIEPKLVNRFRLVFQVSHRAVSSIAVFDGGAAMTPAGDYPTLSALLAATLLAGQYATCLALGLFRLGGAAAVKITADVEVGTAADRSAPRVVQQIIDILNADGAGVVIDEASFDALHALQPAEVVCHVEDDTDAQEIAVKLLGDIGAVLDPGTDGVLRVFRIDEPGEPEQTFGLRQIVSADFAFVVNPDDEGGAIPAWSVVLKYGGVQVVQSGSDVVAGASDARRALVAEPYETAEPAQDEAVLEAHPNAVEITLETSIRYQADADAEAARRLAFFKVRRDRMTLTVPDSIGRCDLGSVQAVQLSRFGYDAGKSGLVLGRSDDFGALAVTLELLG